MPGESESGGAFDPVVKPFIDFWSDYVKQANDVARELLEGIDDGTDVKSLQRKWFDAVAKSMDAYMRSPAFLQTMKRNTDTIVKVKRRTDDLATEVARNANIPTANDISGLFERLRSVEETILSQLGRVEQRLQSIEEQMSVGQTVGR
jgi:hypothetical protein